MQVCRRVGGVNSGRGRVEVRVNSRNADGYGESVPGMSPGKVRVISRYTDG